ncbi:MAG: VanZ family protein [Candidatus Acidiferrales bacterium]
MRRRIGPWIAAALWAGWIFFASTERFGGAHTSRIVIPILRWLFPHAAMATLLAVHLAIRKSAHVFEYFVFSVLLWLGIRTAPGRWQFRWALLAVAIAGVYGASDEFHQIFVPGRGASVHDVMIDVCGAILAQVVIWLWLRPRRENIVA